MPTLPREPAAAPVPPPRWAKVIDQTRCIGCHACTTACKSENEVPLGVTRTYVKSVDAGVFPLARRAFQVTRCNQCDRAPCTTACPTAAMFRRSDGIVDFDKSVCIGCKACIAACPYDAIFINPEDGFAEKCNFCAHRLDVGLAPSCVIVCPTEAILVGDLNDAASPVTRLVNREALAVRRPEKGTHPKLFYRGGHPAALDPLAAARPGGGLFMWSEQSAGPGLVVSGHPAPAGAPNNSAAALLSYDIPHGMPWDWRVSLYTLTKSVAAGAYLVAWLLAAAGGLALDGAILRWIAPAISLAFLAITGALLVWDLEHPERFWMIFTRPQWRSWLVRGGFILAGFGLCLAAHAAAPIPAAIPGIPLAVLAAAYTGWLFAQAKGRDLWQSPLTAPHLVVQALVAGAAALLPAALLTEPAAAAPLALLLSIAGGVHLLLIAAELMLPHPTVHASLAAREITRGRYRGWLLTAVAAGLAGLLAPWAGLPAAAAAVLGIGAFEHAWVQGGQSVPQA